MNHFKSGMLLTLLGAPLLLSAAGDFADLQDQARQALRRGVAFFDQTVSVRGTYLWQYSEDLARREGEGQADKLQGWVQPPGTPAVGLALLEAYELTGEALCLQAATNTAAGLLWGQLRSGGWAYYIDFAANPSRPLAYRHLTNAPPKARNDTILDDDNTTAALRFLMRLDATLAFTNQPLHEAVVYALTNLLAAQRPNGGFPQVFNRPVNPAEYPPLRASFPEEWSRTWPGTNYHEGYTLNDQVHADVLDTLWLAARLYPSAGAEGQALARRCRAAAVRGADFLLMAQMPEPQPAWAQQYNPRMQPMWARRFEPPAISGSESQGALSALMRAFRETADARYLEPIPRALAYLQRSRLPDGRLARFYELQSNRPLFFTKDYRLTYEDDDLPTHYSFKVSDRTASLAREFEALKKLPPAALTAAPPARVAMPADTSLAAAVRKIIAAQDARGAWVEEGRLKYHGSTDPTRRVIRSETFIRNLGILARFLAASHSASQ